MIQTCENYCISLMRAVIQGLSIPEMPEGLTLQELFAFAKKHSVEALVYHGLCEMETIDETDPVWQYWTNRAEMILTQSIVQLADRDTIFETLTAEGIDLLPIKGCWLKEQYPEIDYRQMSDLDMLIRKEDRVRVSQIMQELGYESEGLTRGGMHDNYEKPPYTEAEIHFALLLKGDPRYSYYDNIWEKAKPVDGTGHLYRLRPEDEYIYYFLHMQKHATTAGIGIKAILDSVVYRSCFADMDRGYLQNELKKLGVWELANQVETMADCWFATGDTLPEEIQKFAANILEDGAYGTEAHVLERRLEKIEERYKNRLIRQMAYWCSRFFLPMEEMVSWYPILEKMPVLLPFCWFNRFMDICVRHPKMLLRRLKFVKEKGESHG